MIFREAFWVVVGGVAPIIALAVVVSMGEMQTPVLRINRLLKSLGISLDNTVNRRPRSPDEPNQVIVDLVKTKTNRINKVIWPMLYLDFGNLGIQAALLCIGLLSIALQTNLIPPWVAVVGETAGVIFLAVVEYFIMVAKGYVTDVEDLDSSYYPQGQ
jgi:hypothetical protein